MLKIKEIESKNQKELFLKYKGQNKPQPVFIELDTRSGVATVQWK